MNCLYCHNALLNEETLINNFLFNQCKICPIVVNYIINPNNSIGKIHLYEKGSKYYIILDYNKNISFVQNFYSCYYYAQFSYIIPVCPTNFKQFLSRILSQKAFV